MGRKPKDITGQRFGHWTVIESAGRSHDGRSLWLCKCDCGTTRVVYGSSLLRGNTKSCGCSRGAPRSRDISGQRFGRLTAVELVGSDRNRRAMWLCQCDCGNQIELPCEKLTRGNTKSCGCLSEKRITFNGKTQNMKEWAQELGISYITLAKRFSRGWSAEEALTKPIQEEKRRRTK